MTGTFNNEEDNSDLFGRSEEEKRRHRAEQQPKFTKNRALSPVANASPSKKKVLLFTSPLIVGLLFLCLPVNASKFLTGVARVLRDGKHFDSAMQVCNLAVQVDPANARSYMIRATINDDCEHYDLAIADYNRAAIADPQLVDALVGRGMAHYKSHDYKSATEDFDQALKVQPDNADIYVRRGIAHARLGEYDAALADYDQATKIDPTNSEALYNKGWVMDLQYDQTMENENENSGAKVSALGSAQKSNLSAQVADLSKKLEQAKTDPQLYYTRGLACLKLRKMKEAIADFNEAIRLNPKMASAYVNRGLAYSSEKVYDKAIADYTAGLAVNSQNASAYYRRGLAYDRTAKYSAALADYHMAERLNPSGSKLYATLAAADQQRLNPAAAKQAPTKPRQVAEKTATPARPTVSSAAADPDVATAMVQPNIGSTSGSAASIKEHLATAMDYSLKLKHPEALAAWIVVLKEQPQNPTAKFLYHREKGMVDNMHGDFADSVRELNAAAAMSTPKNSYFYKWRAKSYHALGDNERALSDIAQGLRLNPEDKGILDLRREILRQTGAASLASQNGGDGSSMTASSSQTNDVHRNSDTTKGDHTEVNSDWQNAKRCDQNRQYEQAIYFYKQIVSLNPKTDTVRGAYRKMGEDYLKLRDYNNTLAMSVEVIKLGAHDAEIHRQRGEAYLGLGQYQFALNEFNTGIRINPKRIDCYRGRSKVYKALGRADLAAADENTVSEMESR